MIRCISPRSDQEWQRYYHFRWQMLRAAWQRPLGSEQDKLEDQAIHRMLVAQNGEILGVGRVHFSSQYQAQIRYMAVKDDLQGQGLGKRLIAELEYQTSLRGGKHILLNAREIAIPFYQRQGYQLGALSHVLYDQIKHFAMSKQLNPLPDNNLDVIHALQTKWHQTIPVSKAMNLAICFYDGTTIISHCDLEFNKNIHNTMFAGSINTLATLNGWGWIYLYLAEQKLKGNIVLADATIKYLAPINGVVAARSGKAFTQIKSNTSKSNNKMRFSLSVEVLSGEHVAALFTGNYVVTDVDVAAEDKIQ